MTKKRLFDVNERIELLHNLRLMLLASAEKLEKVLLQACYSDSKCLFYIVHYFLVETVTAMMALPSSWTHVHDRNIMRLTCAFGWGVCRVGRNRENIYFSEPYENLGIVINTLLFNICRGECRRISSGCTYQKIKLHC